MFAGLVHSAPTSSLLPLRYLPELLGVEAAIAEINAEPIITENASRDAILTIRDFVSTNAIRGSGMDFESPRVDV